VTDPSIGGMKALLLDPVTTKVVSMVYSQTQILEQEVYLVEQLGKHHEPMTHLKAAIFIQPTEANLSLLLRELKDPKFAEYHIYFSNRVSPHMITRLGRADEHEVVRQVQEYYADYLVANEDLFHLGIDNSLILSSPSASSPVATSIRDRNVSGIISLLLSLKKRPSQVRYSASSTAASKIASDVCDIISKDDVFDFRRSQDGPLVLVLDRMDDPVTPLLTQWTYQAMVHELLGINNNRVSLKDTPGAKSKDLEEVVLSSTQDEFFRSHRFDNFGDLGEAIKYMLDDYQKKSKMNENISSIEDMQQFMDRYPAFRSSAINVSKHVALMSELARLTDVCQLLTISQLEQEIVCGNDHNLHKNELYEKIRDPRIVRADKIRLALLYLIRYESYHEIREIQQKLTTDAKANSAELALLNATLEYAGDSRRAPNLFGQGGLMASLSKQLQTTIQGVENVYTQHKPLLAHILDNINKNKLKDSSFPYALNECPNASPKDIVIFMVGGTTYEEAMNVSEFNKVAANSEMNVYFGGSCIHNSVSFLKEIGNTFKSR
jgi:vacuolar protein sorting-associated protein 45